MTVETETVRSIPQAPIGLVQGERIIPGRAEPSGSLRLKASNETIRPKKDKKKTIRKAPSIVSGTASSKADIFEAKVASAVDEANSSDSDETFVYESNPPDTQPHVRHHSRTPSVNSMASLAETSRGGFRPVLQAEPHRSIAGKRSMKFANVPYYNSNLEDDTYDRPDGSMRSNHTRPSGSHSVHHHHIGRYGRNNMVSGLFEDAALPQPKSRSASGYASRHGSAPSSPKFPHYATRHGIPTSRKIGELSAYDMDGEGADDERTPLIGTVRSSRNRTLRPRPNSASLRHLDHYERSRGGCLRQFAGCFVLTIMVLLLAFGAVGFLFATTKPLRSVQVREIQNVLASEQEIMLDLLVEAINPNIVAVTIADMDVNIFAKSKHVGTDSWWREHDGLEARSEGPSESRGRRQRKSIRSISSGGGEQDADSPVHALDDDPHDPVEDPSGDSQTMLLGRIFHFDSPLLFEGDPLQRRPHSSIGELRLQKPGNKTEAGGTERWERVIQYPFELIVRGILRYQLPLSSSTHTAPIGASVIVHPEKGVGESGHMWIEPIPFVAAEEDDSEWVEVEVVPVSVEKGSSMVDPPPPPRPATDA
ncbi:uncharacterized protein K452DRAFT_217284 [Aplosporella prunicola CBS 121167]|uniref:Vacuolar segregation subunit 7 n=1 Tax=Aplosporella prunicola CBS 121167 TaxID=1176127 RepID=A0A6A6BTG5_9PEZI|nr:uncharacterized protein K452DRAFT_217284 [Aplosporella prunicola CBS 121167]KAF2147376.1 hypothetical protein K452DRAFT_217284 [Aplosporella prunicola CBS 121167]